MASRTCKTKVINGDYLKANIGKNMDVTQQQQGPITLKSLLIGFILMPANYYWLTQLEVIRYSFPTAVAPVYTVVFNLLLLLLLNFFLKKFLPFFALSRADLLVVYVMLTVTSVLCSSQGTMVVLFPIIGHAFWFATPENEWKAIFWRYLPKWLTIDDESVLKEFYSGDSTLYTFRHIKGWLVPVATWTVFIFALIFIMFCINLILRKQWIDREKLSYPIVQLPLNMTTPSFFKNKLMWIGFAVAGIISILNGFSSIYPQIPQIPVKRQSIGYLFTERPWSALASWTLISFYPFGIGLSFLMPLELLFSCWFFFLFYKIQLVFADMFGYKAFPSSPLLTGQQFGAYIGICIFALWAGRKYLKQAFFGIFGGKACLRAKRKVDDSGEPVRKRTAILGLICGAAFLILFSMKAGMSLWVILMFFAIYYALSISATRIRAEIGFPVVDMDYMGPFNSMVSIVGTRSFPPRSLTIFALFRWFSEYFPSNPMPHQLEAFKLASGAKINSRGLFFVMLAATFCGILICFWILLSTSYSIGVDSGQMNRLVLGNGERIFGGLQSWLYHPTSTDYPAIAFMILGFFFTLFLTVMRLRFLWWPFHPLGYALGCSWGMYNLWFCLFLSSIAKWLILKHGGCKAYRRATPFFLGLILGDFTMGSLWSITGIVFSIPTYDFWP